jgi:predicted nuclease of restriction endonuclease-like (RecB) superfamily
MKRPSRRKPPAKKAINLTAPDSEQAAFDQIASVLTQARQSATRAVNFAMVLAYWEIGRIIVEHEQGGQNRAEYGARLIESLSHRLSEKFGRGFTASNLWQMRQFHLAFPAPVQSSTEILHTPSGESPLVTGPARGPARILHTLCGELSWSHYRLLMRIESPAARQWYMQEAASSQWSVRQLDRQIAALYYERLLASRNPEPVRKEAARLLGKDAGVRPEDVLRDPYILEFLNLRDHPSYREGDLESALIENLQTFLLELGRGFAFVARQQRLVFDGEEFSVDLVFYNYLLRCFVLIDLKLGKLTHQDVGQMDTYVRYYTEQRIAPGDEPPIGLILCSQKNEAVARYSVLAESRQVFASRYQLHLPTVEELEAELKRERRLIEQRLQQNPPPADR